MVVRTRLPLKGPALVFITTTVVDWTPVFSDSMLARLFINQLGESAVHFSVSVCGYVLMPSHVHALLGFSRIEELSTFMNFLKRESARQIRDMLPPDLSSKLIQRGRYNLWRPRFDDLVVWSEKQFKIKMEYIHSNPVRAGLVDEATEYPYSSARDWLLNQPGEITIEKEWKWT